jgi:hypothetical protein
MARGYVERYFDRSQIARKGIEIFGFDSQHSPAADRHIYICRSAFGICEYDEEFEID